MTEPDPARLYVMIPADFRIAEASHIGCPVLVLLLLGFAVRLVVGILQTADVSTPGQLLSLGVAVWSTNVIARAVNVL